MSHPITKKHLFWKDIPQEQWNSWIWQQANRITKMDQLTRIEPTRVSRFEKVAFDSLTGFMMGITPYYLSLIDFDDPYDPIRLQSVPQIGETMVHIDEVDDPLAEEYDMPVPGLTHRYPDRVLLYTTHNCPVYCRHCTRKRKVSDPHSAASTSQIELGLEYIKAHPEIRDVVISGGDPLSMSDDRLMGLIRSLQDIDHIQMMRIGTRNLVTLPQRITEEFADRLKELNLRHAGGKRKPVYINTHFNNPAECTAESDMSCHRLMMAGSPLGNQSVLLKGVNDDIQTMKELCTRLLQMGVKPYYIYLCDPAPGTGHFRTPVEKGLEIIDNLRGHTTGFATPQLVIDAPGGGGKILIPNGIVGRNVGSQQTIWKLVNFEGKIFYYLAPNDDTGYYRRLSKPVPPEFNRKELEKTYLKEAIRII